MKQYQLRLSASLLVIFSMVTAPVSAQEQLHAAATETVHLQVGDIFEILPATDIANATYTWILTQDRTFLEATRAPIFRKRLIQPGQYTLFAEIASPDGSRRITRSFTLDYRARQPGQSNTAEQAVNGELVHTTPATDPNGRVAMPAGTQLLLITPVNPDVRPLNLDTDLSRDSNGDGNLENDLEGDQTFFGSDATPLYLWITDEPLTKHSLSITAAGAEGGKVQKIDVLDEVSARNEGMVQGPMHISSEEKGNRTYRFSAVFDGPAPAGSQLLYQWQFGDNQQSLVTKPEHTFAEDGVYTVSLLIRNLRDGKDIVSASTVVSVAASGETGGTPSSQASSEPQEQPDDETPSTPRDWSSILMLGGLFVGSILLGILAVVALSFLRKKKTTIADTFEKVEQTLVKSPAEAPTLTIAPPAATVVASTTPAKRETPPASIAEHEEETKTESEIAKPTPTVNTKEAPAWLKDGLSADTTPPKQTPAPAPAPTPVTPPVVAKSATTPQPRQTPAWLQQPTAPATPKPAAVPPPVKQAPAPTPAQINTPAVTPAVPEQKQPVVPAWQSQPAKKPEQPQPTSAKSAVQAQTQNRSAMPQQPKPAVPAQSIPTPAPQKVVTVPTPVQTTPKPVTPPVVPPPTPIVPPSIPSTVVPAVTPTPQTIATQKVPTAAIPVVPPAPKAPMPVVPTPTIVPAETPQPVTPVAPTVQSPTPMSTPVQPAMTPPVAPVQQNKPPMPVVPPQAPQPVPPTTVQVPETPQKPAPIDIPKAEARSSDEPIAFIRAESLNPPSGQNG